ncbi:hypothetical protein [Nocardioides dongkuii]|uniref:hypothetical protein n=1 Tax=Nocardioides dongkuii TaxID=2760089 RepID=UPI0015FB277C|nr:hypothetical protein [Nocardioides dongkuii]
MLDRRRQVRRKVTLEVLSLAVPTSAAVFLSGRWILEWNRGDATLVTVVTAAVLGALWLWRRTKVPATIEVEVEADADAEGERELGTSEEDSGEDGRWDLSSVLLVAVAAVAVVALVAVGLLVQFLLPLSVVLLFSLAHGSPGLADVASTVGATLAVAFVLELVVVLPLSRWWGLPFDD